MTVIKVNRIEVRPGGHEDLEQRFLARIHETDGAPGFLGAELWRPDEGEAYLSISRWESEQAFADFAAAAAEDVRTGEWRGDSAAGAELSTFFLVEPAEG